MVKHVRMHMAAWLLVALIVTTACAPASGRGGSTEQESAPRERKVLNLATRVMLLSFADFVGTDTGNDTMLRIAHDQLTWENESFEFVPQLATELPSVERGTWKINPDGTMETTWKLRANVKWHDGTPFTAQDLVFSHRLHTDDTLKHDTLVRARLMESATALDPYTLVVRWSRTVVDAHKGPSLRPFPKHLLESLYQGDREAFHLSPFWHREFVGLGAYRIARWEDGVGVEFAPFDAYYLGKPPLDGIVVKYIQDPGAMLANIIAGAVDVVEPPSVDLEAAADQKQRWEGTGNQVLVLPGRGLKWLRPQYRSDYTMLRNGMTNPLVRKGLTHALDRQTLADAFGQGFLRPADSWMHPEDAFRPAVESAIPKYPYDPTRAQQLLAEAGWTSRGSDGVLVHQSGERFTARLSVRPTTGADKDAAVIRDFWKAVGVDLDLYFMSRALSDDREHLSTQPFLNLSSNSPNLQKFEVLHSKNIASPANRWNGSNNHGYSNPRADGLMDLLDVTIETSRRVPIIRDLLQEVMGEAAFIPLYHPANPLFLLSGVRFHTRATPFNWDKA